MKQKPLVTICIPTFNGEKYIEEVLESVFSQKTKFFYEVLIIDSGSIDNTLKIVSKFPVKIKKIKNEDFGHGKTRNLAVNIAKGEFIVFLTQDATPSSNKWLAELIKPFFISNNIVATYGRHIPREDAPPFIKKDIEYFFDSISSNSKKNIIIQKAKPNKSYSAFEWGRLIFFSDVNCALRKSFVKNVPYEDVDYAEDQLMGKKIIELGFAKAYVAKAAVYHSHSYPIFEYLFRYFDEYRGLRNVLGYKDPINLINIWRETVKGWISDVKYIYGLPNKDIRYKTKWIILSLVYNFERRLGALFAKNEEKLPKVLVNLLSMEYRLKNKSKLSKNKEANRAFSFIYLKFKKLIFVYQRYGWRGVVKLVKEFLLKNLGLGINNRTLDNSPKFIYEYINKVDLSLPPKLNTNIKIKKHKAKYVLNWIVPDFGIGSGGHMTIFRIIRFLESKGFRNNIYMFGPLRYENAAIIKDTIDKYFIKINSNVYLGTEYMEDSDAVVATSWHTAYPAFNITNTRKKIYLVQDFEPFFYPHSSEFVFAENTYKMGFFHICASRWLSEKIKKEYNGEADFFNLGYDEEYYYPPEQDAKRDEKTIIFYGRWATPRRGFELGILALWEVYKKIPNVKIKIFGWDERRKDIPFPYDNLGVLSPKKLGNLYRRSTIGLSISLTNVSLVVREMMACGLPVVEVNNPSITLDFKNHKEILVSELDPKQIAKNIIFLLKNPTERQQIAENALKKVKREYTWEKGLCKINNILKKVLS